MKKGLSYCNKTAEHDTTAWQSPKRMPWTCARLAVKELSKIVGISLSWGMCSFLVAKQPCCELQCGRHGNIICRAVQQLVAVYSCCVCAFAERIVKFIDTVTRQFLNSFIFCEFLASLRCWVCCQSRLVRHWWKLPSTSFYRLAVSSDLFCLPFFLPVLKIPALCYWDKCSLP